MLQLYSRIYDWRGSANFDVIYDYIWLYRDVDEEDEEETREWEMRQIRNAGITKKGPKQLRDTRPAAPTHKTVACKSEI